MPLIILQPCGDGPALRNFDKTIRDSVPLDEIAGLLTPNERNTLQAIYLDNNVKLWGVTSAHASKWDRIEPGDITLFVANRTVFTSAVVTYKIQNQNLALKLWGTQDGIQTWEYVYFVSEVNRQNIAVSKINSLISYVEHKVVQGFSVLNPTQSDSILSAFDLQSETFYSEKTSAKILNNLRNVTTLDTLSFATSRKEQDALRCHLFGNSPVAKCCICGGDFPVPFLVAAHIKKRAECEHSERIDFENIVSPMCKFGCDDLYEKGIIGIVEGVVTRLNAQTSTDRVEGYLESILGKYCSSWAATTAKYFDWHVSKHQKNAIT